MSKKDLLEAIEKIVRDAFYGVNKSVAEIKDPDQMATTVRMIGAVTIALVNGLSANVEDDEDEIDPDAEYRVLPQKKLD
jgi:hypothetical protein